MDTSEKKPENKPDKIIVHHTAAEAPTPQFDAVNEWHRQRDFTKSSLGFFVGYHYLIEKDGTLKQARDDKDEGCHTIGENLASIGIALAGDFSKTLPSPDQINTLGQLLTDLTGKYGIHPTRIFPHKVFSSTACYGGKLDISWGTLVYLSHSNNPITKVLKKIKGK